MLWVIVIIVAYMTMDYFLPSSWVARITAGVLFLFLISFSRDRREIDSPGHNDYILVLELVAFAFILHLLLSHGNIPIGD